MQFYVKSDSLDMFWDSDISEVMDNSGQTVQEPCLMTHGLAVPGVHCRYLVYYGHFTTFLATLYLVIWTCKPIYPRYAVLRCFMPFYRKSTLFDVVCHRTLKETRLNLHGMVNLGQSVPTVSTSVNLTRWPKCQIRLLS